MMRGTIYVMLSETDILRSVESLDVETPDAFKAEARRRWPSGGSPMEFGPIGPPWSDVR